MVPDFSFRCCDVCRRPPLVTKGQTTFSFRPLSSEDVPSFVRVLQLQHNTHTHTHTHTNTQQTQRNKPSKKILSFPGLAIFSGQWTERQSLLRKTKNVEVVLPQTYSTSKTATLTEVPKLFKKILFYWKCCPANFCSSSYLSWVPVIFVAASIFGILRKSATFRNKYSKANVTLRIPWRVGGEVGR